MGVSNLTGKRLKNIKDLAVSQHLLQCNCTIDFDHFDTLATDVNKFNLLVKESLLIKRYNPVLNHGVLNRTTKSFFLELSLCEKCPNTELFLVRIFPHSD